MSPRDARAPAMGTGTGTGALVLDHALARWRRVRSARGADGAAGPDRADGRAADDGLETLARRLDDSGCAFGRVSAARVEYLTRAYERLETKLNAILMAVTGTFLSTLAGLLLYYVRGASH